jgi:hypothetical protein
MIILNSNALKDDDTEEVKINKKKEIKFYANDFFVSMLLDKRFKKSEKLINRQSFRYYAMELALDELFKTRPYEK